MRERKPGCAALEGQGADFADPQVMAVGEYARRRAWLLGVCYTAAG